MCTYGSISDQQAVQKVCKWASHLMVSIPHLLGFFARRHRYFLLSMMILNQNPALKVHRSQETTCDAWTLMEDAQSSLQWVQLAELNKTPRHYKLQYLRTPVNSKTVEERDLQLLCARTCGSRPLQSKAAKQKDGACQTPRKLRYLG